MAWQLHYTSAREGPTGRAGFQFVAATPDLPEGVRAAVTPYLAYRPPPDAPLAPDDAELARFPVAFLYDRVDGRPLLLRCRYLGRDYSGRYGNFFAHAVVAEPAELEGLRPAELWRAPLWADGPAPDERLGGIAELTPGAALDPEALAAWLAATGIEDPYRTLARLVDAAVKVLDGGRGRVVLVADDATVARWIALITYSLPVDAAARLTFTTYTADPDGAAQYLVGTTPGVWAATRAQSPDAFALRPGDAFTEDGAEPSRFGRTVAACWRDADFAGLDALGELSPLEGRADAAALVALCRSHEPLTGPEQEAAARLRTRHPHAMPEWIRDELARRVPAALAGAATLPEVASAAADAAMTGVEVNPAEVAAAAEAAGWTGGELASVIETCPEALRGALMDGVLVRLARRVRDRTPVELDDAAVCELLYRHAPGLASLPDLAIPVLASVGSRHPERWGAIMDVLLELDVPPADLVPAFEEMAASPPDADECARLVDAHPAAFARFPTLAALPSGLFERLSALDDGAQLCAAPTLRLAARVRALLPGGSLGRDAELVQAYADAVTADDPESAARALSVLADGTSPLAANAFTGALRTLARRPPRFRAALLTALAEAARARTGEQWTADLPRRSRTDRNDLVEVVLRMRRQGTRDPALERWAADAADGWLAVRLLASRLASDPDLQDDLHALRDEFRTPAAGPGAAPDEPRSPRGGPHEARDGLRIPRDEGR